MSYRLMFHATLTILSILCSAIIASCQVSPTSEQLQFVNILGGRIRSKCDAEVAGLKTQQLNPAIALEAQTEATRSGLAQQTAKLAGRIEAQSWLVTEYPQIRGTMDKVGNQQLNFLRSELRSSNQSFAALQIQLTAANNAATEARARRVKIEETIASKQGESAQLIKDLNDLYKTWRLSPPQYSWEAMLERLTQVAHEKQIKSNVTVSTGTTPVTVRYQLGSAGQIFSAPGCVRCVLSVDVGNYNFWIDKGRATESEKKPLLVFQETQTIDMSQP